MHTDHLGSLTAITDESGELVELHSYDAWGQRRSLNATTMNTLLGSTLWGNLTGLQLVSGATTKGYTGHENFDGTGIIHMNGRIYDPVIARFLQADPIIQDTTDLQAFNRYSYVQNRPLSLTDPSGYSSLGDAWDKVKDVYKAVDPIGYAVMKVQAKAHQALAREVGRLFIKVPELQAVTSAALVVMQQYYALALFNTGVAGSVTYQSGGQFGDILESSAFAFTTSAVSAGVGGSGFWAEGLAGINGVKGFVASVGFAGAMSKAQGGKFFDGRQFVKGLAIGLAVQGVMESDWFKAALAGDVPEGGYGAGGDRNRAVYAAEDGKVDVLGWQNPNDTKQGYGFRLELTTDEGTFKYGHLDPASMSVKEGASVAKGDLLGFYADPSNGSAKGPHLHFEWIVNGKAQDPTKYLSTVMPDYIKTSGMGYRIHPVTGIRKMHYGIDIVGPYN